MGINKDNIKRCKIDNDQDQDKRKNKLDYNCKLEIYPNMLTNKIYLIIYGRLYNRVED